MPNTANTMPWDKLYIHAQLATFDPSITADYGTIDNGALAIQNGKIAWLGSMTDLPEQASARQTIDATGRWIIPGLIDCHTHVVYAGNRSGEFAARLNGVAYKTIAQQGGGILSTVRAVRAASESELLRISLPRVRNLQREGVTCLEIKSGYGLDLASERKMLRVAKQIGEQLDLRVKTTFLGAHALPPEYTGQSDAYIDLVCGEMLPSLAGEGLIDAVDVFCETIGFSRVQTERVFQAAQSLNLPVKLHAEQLSNQEGAALVAQYHGLSADHLEYLSASGIAAMQTADTVAVLLPGAFYTLRETKLPPIGELLTAKVAIAISTDCNPGTSPIPSLLSVMNMACTLFRLTPQTVLQGVTVNAAKALGLGNCLGQLKVGYLADAVLWDIDSPAELCYYVGYAPENQRV